MVLKHSEEINDFCYMPQQTDQLNTQSFRSLDSGQLFSNDLYLLHLSEQGLKTSQKLCFTMDSKSEKNVYCEVK